MTAEFASDDILDRLKRLVVDRVAIDPTTLVPNARLAEIGIDSFALIELVFLAEEEFGVRIPMDQVEAKTVADIVAIIGRAVPA